jgi:hypothetical protein
LSAYETKEDAAVEHTALSNAVSSAVYSIETQLTAYETKTDAAASYSALSAAIGDIESILNSI